MEAAGKKLASTNEPNVRNSVHLGALPPPQRKTRRDIVEDTHVMVSRSISVDIDYFRTVPVTDGTVEYARQRGLSGKGYYNCSFCAGDFRAAGFVPGPTTAAARCSGGPASGQRKIGRKENTTTAAMYTAIDPCIYRRRR